MLNISLRGVYYIFQEDLKLLREKNNDFFKKYS